MNDIILCGDSLEVLRSLDEKSINCCVTSPPYWGLRDYGVDGQLGLEKSPEEYIEKMVAVFREVKRVLRDDGTLWLNIGDSYAGSGRDMNGDGSAGKQSSAKQRSNTGSIVDMHDKLVELGAIGRSWVKPPIGLKPKDLVGIPWMLAFALRADGWYLRQDIIWSKPNPMPESVTDRCTKAHEYIFMLSKSAKYYYNADAIKEPCQRGDAGSEYTTGKTAMHQQGRAGNSPRKVKVPGGWKTGEGPHTSVTHTRTVGEYSDTEPSDRRNKRSVWTVATQPFKEAHFATFPPKLIIPCVQAGCPVGGIVLDPFMGAGTTGLVAKKLDRHYVGIELNPEYIKIAQTRIEELHPSLFE